MRGRREAAAPRAPALRRGGGAGGVAGGCVAQAASSVSNAAPASDPQRATCAHLTSLPPG